MSGATAGTSAAGGGAGNAGSNSRRKRKNQSSRSNRTQAGGHPGHSGGFAGQQGQRQFGPGHPRGGGPMNNQMPPPGMHPHPPQSTGMGWGTTMGEDPIDFILDDLDKLTGRDIALARYKRNHELINLIFDARKIDSLRPSPSPYADKDQEDLRSQLAKYEDEIQQLRSTYSTKFRQWRDELRENDDLLHAPPKRIRVQLEQREEKRKEEAELDETNERGELIAPWATMPGAGEVMGVGFIRQKTPEEVRKLLPKAPEPEPEPEPKPTSATTSQTQANNDVKTVAPTTNDGTTVPLPQGLDTVAVQNTNSTESQKIEDEPATTSATLDPIQPTVQATTLDMADVASVQMPSDANLPTAISTDGMDLTEEGGDVEVEDEGEDDQEGEHDDEDDGDDDDDDDGDAEDDDAGITEDNIDEQVESNLQVGESDVKKVVEVPVLDHVASISADATNEPTTLEPVTTAPVIQEETKVTLDEEKEDEPQPFDASMAESFVNDDTFATAADGTQEPSAPATVVEEKEINDVEMNLDDFVQQDEVQALHDPLPTVDAAQKVDLVTQPDISENSTDKIESAVELPKPANEAE